MSGIPAGAGQLLGKRLGKFEILALLALGGTAEIYLARLGGNAGFEKYVVVKCLHDHLADDPEFVKMFLDEARLAAHLDHSNIVQTMELGEHEGRYYMVMEFLAGLSLAMIVRRSTERLQGGRIPTPLVLNMLAQACGGLHYAHEKLANGKPLNIVHRDISPQNLVVSFEGVVKVVDFGIAKAELRETRTRSGTIKGKFAYMSPEQCVAQNVDRRTDVFALGVIAHELLTGRRLFKRPSPYETYQAVIDCDVKPPSALAVEVDPAIDPIIMRALAKDKDQRYATAEAFGDALAGYLHHRGKGAGPNEIGRFFEQHFAQEIDEHGARMRELISGRVDAVVAPGWGEEEEKPEPSDDKSMVLGTQDIEELYRGSSMSLSSLIDDLGASRTGDADEFPAEKTRIESNPLDRINELEKIANTPKPVLVGQKHRMPPSGPLPLPDPPPGPVFATKPPPGTGSSGRFPDLANLPTMLAAQDLDVAAIERAEHFAAQQTVLEVQPLDAGASGVGLGAGPSSIAQGSGTLPPSNVLVPPNAGYAPHGRADAPTARPAPPPRLPGMAPPPPAGYPVVDALMSAQIAAGATVFPSGAHGAVQPQQHRLPESGSLPMDPALAASLMSPVGNGFPDHDWAAAAAAPARAIPKWLLGVIFVGAIAAALLLTVIIAKLAR